MVKGTSFWLIQEIKCFRFAAMFVCLAKMIGVEERKYNSTRISGHYEPKILGSLAPLAPLARFIHIFKKCAYWTPEWHIIYKKW